MAKPDPAPTQTGAQAKRRRSITRQEPTVRRQDLLDVTISTLARLGPRGATGREICRQAGVSHGLLRHYFKNPQKLLFETYEEVCDRFIERLEKDLADPDPDPWQALDRFFASLFSDASVNSDLLRAWLAFWSLVHSDPDFARKNEEFNVQFRHLLANAMARLPRTEGAVPIEDAVPIMSAVMDGLWLDFGLSPQRLSRDRAIRLCNLTLRQLIPREGATVSAA